MIRKFFAGILLSLSVLALSGCIEDDATIVQANMIKAADNFEVNRRIVFYNGITDTYMLEIIGLCSMNLNSSGTAFNAICKVGAGNDYKRHTLVLSDNTTAFIEQIDAIEASPYYYRATFKPQSILPDIDFRGAAELPVSQP